MSIQTNTDTEMSYAKSGVSYADMDPFKIAAQKAAAQTAENANRFGFKELTNSRGESAYLIETEQGYIAQVEEGLGTKNMVADKMYELTGKTYYDQIAQDTVAMIVNDMITLGALPASIAMHLAVGNSDWFKDKQRANDLVDGWKAACDMSRSVWGGGETPTLKGMVTEGCSLISGSAWGVIQDKKNLLEQSKLQDGDAIVLIASSGIHANGVTMARAIADQSPEGYLTKLSDGRSYGEALLDPTVIYVPLIEDCQKAGLEMHYTANITGHGWRKLMRADRAFEYIVEEIPQPQALFDHIQKIGNVSEQNMYGDFNMGAGFAIYLPKDQANKVEEIAKENNMQAIVAGELKACAENHKKVVIKPKNLEFDGSTLALR